MKMNVFEQYHPLVIFLYFCGAISFSMCTMNPFFITASFIAASLYFIYLKGFGAYLKSMKFYLIMFLVVMIINPLFNALGLTVLFYLWGRPITLEALMYGISSGGMLITVVIWFRCYSEVMTSDKFLALFGRIAPNIAMMVAMVLRYIPETIRKSQEISISQKALLGDKKLSKRARFTQGVNMASILMSWSLEDSIETADSMKCRGYGCGKRSLYDKQAMNRFDVILLIILLLLISSVAVIIFTVANTFVFYPYLSMPSVNAIFYILYLGFLTLPLILEGKEKLQWMLSSL
ncbi:MAG TPA: energy-coupling factor transporter transmembrane protein EcfT [Clostridiales bacterium]|nr:energy-coupling factor transporter transmembrane protein EcfT [Clostridiales bacterium]